MTALAESQRSRPLLEVLAAELASREGRWAAVARIATGSVITVVIAMVFQIPQPTYMAYIGFLISKDEKGSYLSRRIVFSREDLMPHEQYLYNHDGQIVTFAHYEKFQNFDGTMFPSVVDIQRPVEELAITLNIVKLRVNEPLRDDQFQLAQPAGSRLINVDDQSTRAENKTSAKPLPEKHEQ